MGFFKAYDLRGTFGVDFDLETVAKVGRSLPAVLRSRNGGDTNGVVRVLVGRDCRESSRPIRDALVRGLLAAGAEVVDLGLSTTPMVYHFTAEDGFDGSVMITASHNPPSDNGLKISRRNSLPMGYDSGLAELEKLVAACDAVSTSSLEGVETYAEPVKAYSECLCSLEKPSFGDLRFAIDCSDGMASLFAKDIFKDAEEIMCGSPDGTFPHHSPNPLKAEARESMARLVREKGLDCGVIFDGDADRAVFLDENGGFIQPDYLIPVVASACGATFGDKVIYDVRTSRGAIEAIRALGAEPVIGKVGHANAKALLRSSGAVCGGELAGHYYFRDFHFCDSGALAALKILNAFARAKEKGLRVSEFLAPICGKYANSGELNFKVEDKPAAIERVLEVAKSLGGETVRYDIDGVRIEYGEGWISVRQSNTEPYLRLVVECDTVSRLKDWKERLVAAIEGRE